MQFLKVPKKDGERVRKELESKALISHEYAIQSNDAFIFIPVISSIPGYSVVKKRGTKRVEKPKNLKEALKGILTNEELELLTTSFDALGSLAIIEIPRELSQREKKIARAIMQVHPAIKTVAKKTGAMSGEFRVRPLEVIAGKKTTEIIYKESGVLMKLDPSQVYFSPRLSHERTRISQLVKPNEHVLVLFAGVGPYALVIAKQYSDAKIVAVELNPVACEYMKENIKLNKLNNVECVCADVHKLVYNSRFLSWADRIIMPLPHSAEQFLEDAFLFARNGCMIHFYSMCEKGQEQSLVRTIEAHAAKKGIQTTIESVRVARPFSARIDQFVVDFKIKKII